MPSFDAFSAHLSDRVRSTAVGPGVTCTVHPRDGGADETEIAVIPLPAAEVFDEYGGGISRTDEMRLQVGDDDREWEPGDEITISEGWAAGKWKLNRETAISANGAEWDCRRVGAAP